MLRFLNDVDLRLSILLIEKKVESRKDASSGFFLSTLLPLSYTISRLKLIQWSECDDICFKVCFSFLVYFIITILQISKNKKFLNFWTSMVSLVTASSLFYITYGSLKFIVPLLVSIISYQILVLHLMKLCPKNFSFGESSLVSQGIILFILSSYYGKYNFADCFSTSTKILQIGIWILILIYAISFGLNLNSKPLAFYSLVLSAMTLLMIPVNIKIIGENPYTWIYNLILSDQNLIRLVTYWSFCIALGSLLVFVQTRTEMKANTVIRKSFHILTVIVFLPGLCVNPCFLYLASGVVFAFLFGLDMVRVLNIPPLGEALGKGYNSFSDEKDCGTFALTPIYLLVGCSLPIWLHPNPTSNHLLPLISGIVTIGIGDSAASLFGTLFGNNYWQGTKKTKEGSAGCFLSQFLFILALIHYGYIPMKDFTHSILAVFVTTLVEAWTDQVDNIVLPLLMFILVV